MGRNSSQQRPGADRKELEDRHTETAVVTAVPPSRSYEVTGKIPERFKLSPWREKTMHRTKMSPDGTTGRIDAAEA